MISKNVLARPVENPTVQVTRQRGPTGMGHGMVPGPQMLSHWLEAAQGWCRGGGNCGLRANVREDAEGLSVNYAPTAIKSGGHIFMTSAGEDLCTHTSQNPESVLLQAWLYLGFQMTSPQYFSILWLCFSWYGLRVSHQHLQAHLLSGANPDGKSLPVSFLII